MFFSSVLPVLFARCYLHALSSFIPHNAQIRELYLHCHFNPFVFECQLKLVDSQSLVLCLLYQHFVNSKFMSIMIQEWALWAEAYPGEARGAAAPPRPLLDTPLPNSPTHAWA